MYLIFVNISRYSGVNIAKFPPVSITLPPLEQQTVTLICTPIEPGELIIRGCQVHIAGCPAKDFLIPTNAVLKGEETIREMSLPLLEHSRLKCRDFQSWYLTRERILTHYNDWEDFQFLACKVIPKQPLLQLKSSSLNGAVAALYEGEV